MPQLPSSRSRPPRHRISKREKYLTELDNLYCTLHQNLLQQVLSGSSSDSDSDSGSQESDVDTDAASTNRSPSLPIQMSSSPVMSPISSVSLELSSQSPDSDDSMASASSTSASSTQTYIEIFEQFQHLYNQLHHDIQHKRVFQNAPPVKKMSQFALLDWFKDHSPQRFKRKVRVSPDTFDSIVCLIENHEIFQNNSHNKQLPVHRQFAIFINRLCNILLIA